VVVTAPTFTGLYVVLEGRVVAGDVLDGMERRRREPGTAQIRVDDDSRRVDDRAQRRAHARLGGPDRVSGEAVGVELDHVAGQDGDAHRLDSVPDGVDHHGPREHGLQSGEILALEQFVGLGERAQKRLLVHDWRFYPTC